MKTKIIYLLSIITFLTVIACSEDDLDSNSIFKDDPIELNEFDKWLESHFTDVYNIDFRYRMEDIESDMKYNLVPAKYDKSIQMAKLVKYLWIEAYDELTEDKEFMRTYCPKVIHLIGSPAYRVSEKTKVLGTAEGGVKITLYDVNILDPTHINALNEDYFKTLHHEFAHILHQTKNFTTDFNLISAADYDPNGWANRTLSTVLRLGFVSQYAGSQPQEDFVEIIAIYVTNTPEYWDSLLSAAGSSGRAIIEEKFDIVKSYLSASWDIDIDELRDIVQRRSEGIADLDLETL